MDRPARRAGFTLIELLIVILIIGFLIAILVPTVAAAFRKAKEAQVSAEMNNLATALASFKNAYGDYPPSRILVCERGYTFAGVLSDNTSLPTIDSNDSDMTVAQLAQRSLLYLQKFWPRADFRNDPGATATPGNFNDFDGNGGKPNTNYIILSGSECLTFFLGGLPINGGSITGLSGFSKSPRFPFVDSATALNRTVPNYEFNTSRLIDDNNNGIPSYFDPIDASPSNRRAYAYFSAYGLNAYDPNDVNGLGYDSSGAIVPELGDDDTTDIERGFSVSFPPNSVVSPSPNPYTGGNPSVTNIAWLNPNSFQIICAGQDRNWGPGGTYNANGGAQGRLPALPKASDAGNIHGDDTTGIRSRESDNLTNFSGGRLD